jgi:hypothetical protein
VRLHLLQALKCVWVVVDKQNSLHFSLLLRLRLRLGLSGDAVSIIARLVSDSSEESRFMPEESRESGCVAQLCSE